MKTAIIYASVHHGNTKKIAEEMASVVSADLIDITKSQRPDISGYELIGFASGIYFGSMHKGITNFIENTSFSENQKIFIVYTCGMACMDYAKKTKKYLAEKGKNIVGVFRCRGYDTFSIWGKLGGIAKNHPDKADFEKAVSFIKNILAGEEQSSK